MKLHSQELLEIKGGAITATLLNALARVVNSIIEIGKMVGSSIRRISTKTYC